MAQVVVFNILLITDNKNYNLNMPRNGQFVRSENVSAWGVRADLD